MNEVELLQLIRQWEDSYTEFKEESAHSDDLAATIVAFANTDGGRLILGVAEDRRITGVTDPDRLMQRIDQICHHNVEPPLVCFQQKADAEAQKVLVVRVPKGPERPYRTNRGVHYIRTASGRRQASREELLRLYQATFDLFPDELPVSRTGLADLDRPYFEAAFQSFYGLAVDEMELPFAQLLRNLKLMREEELTLAGVLLFGRRPQAWLPFAEVTAVRFPGTQMGESFVDRKDIEGTLEQQITGAEAFLKLHMTVSGQIRGFRRHDEHEIPPFVLREAVANAIAHRDYTIRGQVRVFVFDDRVEVINPGRLPNTVTLDNIRLGIHVERNPIIVTFLARLGLVSRIGTGIPRMIRLMREQGLPRPEFQILDSQFQVVLRRPRRVQE